MSNFESELREILTRLVDPADPVKADWAIATIEAYVTTRVKEAERLARIDELSLITKADKFIDSTHCMDCLGTNVVTDRLKALTTTTNGKEE